jgi:hypothetical protein
VTCFTPSSPFSFPEPQLGRMPKTPFDKWSSVSPVLACAVKRRRFPVGARPTRQPLQPEATGAVMEVTKWLKPSEEPTLYGHDRSVEIDHAAQLFALYQRTRSSHDGITSHPLTCSRIVERFRSKVAAGLGRTVALPARSSEATPLDLRRNKSMLPSSRRAVTMLIEFSSPRRIV